jgi:hypothetical protein
MYVVYGTMGNLSMAVAPFFAQKILLQISETEKKPK